LFFIFPTIGIFFSVAALKDLFGAKSELINNFCNLTTSTSCSTIVNSDKWKFFSYINFSDLAIVFFSSQFFGLLLLLLAGNSTDFFSIQFVLLFGSVPIILLSLYFQKIVEKKWCPICLAIISLIILEFIFCILAFDISFSFTTMSLLLLGLVSLFISFVWFHLKNLLSEHKDLKEGQLKSNRFIRNYEIFKNTLISKDKAELPFANIVLGNEESKTILTLITSPFCSYCKEVHEIMERILDKNGNDLQIKLIIKVDLNSLDEDRKLFLRSLMHIYFNESADNFRNKMNYWYENKNIKKWLDYNQVKDFGFSKIDSIYNSQNTFCTNSGYNYTPAIFINGYEYPKLYERKNLEFFINDLINDNF
jgi:disulfide bond formation protein DsbB